jgi:hypothetical protein
MLFLLLLFYELSLSGAELAVSLACGKNSNQNGVGISL